MRKSSPTDPGPKKAICLPFSLFSHPFNFACPSNASSDACPHLSFLLSVHGSSNMQRRNKNGTFSWEEFAFALHFHFIMCLCRSTEIWHQFIQQNLLISQKVNGSCRQSLYPICPYLILLFNSKHIYGNELAWLCTSLWPFSPQAMQCWCEMSERHKFPFQRFLVEGTEASSPLLLALLGSLTYTVLISVATHRAKLWQPYFKWQPGRKQDLESWQ